MQQVQLWPTWTMMRMALPAPSSRTSPYMPDTTYATASPMVINTPSSFCAPCLRPGAGQCVGHALRKGRARVRDAETRFRESTATMHVGCSHAFPSIREHQHRCLRFCNGQRLRCAALAGDYTVPGLRYQASATSMPSSMLRRCCSAAQPDALRCLARRWEDTVGRECASSFPATILVLERRLLTR